MTENRYGVTIKIVRCTTVVLRTVIQIAYLCDSF